MSFLAGRARITGIPRWMAASPRHNTIVGKDKARRVPPPPRHREDPSVAARRAGDCGRHAEPMGYHRRAGVYQRQRNSNRLTARQIRRLNKKLWAHPLEEPEF